MNGLFRRVLAAKTTTASVTVKRMYSATHHVHIRPPPSHSRPGGFSPPFTHPRPHPAQVINDFRQRAILRLNSQNNNTDEEASLPLSEINFLLRESVKAGDFETAEEVYKLARTVEGFDPDGSLATYFLVHLAGERKEAKRMLDFIERTALVKTPFTMELALGVILQTFDHESLDRWLNLNKNTTNKSIVPFTSELLEDMLEQVYLPHLRWDAVISLLREHAKLVTADTWLSILEFGLTPRPAEEAAWNQLQVVLRQMKDAGVSFHATTFADALDTFLSRHYPPDVFLNFLEVEL